MMSAINGPPVPVPYQYPGLLPEPEETQQVPPGRLFAVLWRRKWLVIALIVCITVPAFAYICLLRPYYDATALLSVDTQEASLNEFQATRREPGPDLVGVATQVDVIDSPTIAARVVDKLGLAHDPEFAQQIDAPPSLQQRFIERFLALLGRPEPAREPLSESKRRQLTTDMLLGKILVANDGKTYIVSLRARTGNPELSASITNAFVDTYLQYRQEQKIAAIRRANNLLNEQIQPLADRVTQAEHAVEAYRAKHGLIGTQRSIEGPNGVNSPPGTTVAGQQLAQINGSLITAMNDLALKQAKLRQIELAMRTGQLDASPEVISSPLIASLRAEQARLSSRAASLSDTQMSQNPMLRSALAAQNDVTRRINAEIARIAASVRSEVNAAQAQVSALQASLGRLQGQVTEQSEASVSLSQLESEAQAARTIYREYLARSEQTLNSVRLQESEAERVAVAAVPLSRSGPPRGLYAILALAAALMVSCGFCLVLEQLPTGVRNLDDLELQTGLIGLGYVPLAPRNVWRLFRSNRPSMYTESVRLISSLLVFGQERYRARVVLVTSALPDEGKTFFATSLAATAGRDGHRVLLMECDLRRPSIQKLLGIRRSKGSRVSEEKPQVQRAVLPGVDIITLQPSASNAPKLLALNQIHAILEDAREHYDLIVLDTPPVLPFADAPVLSMRADGAILVVRWRKTPVSMVTSAAKVLSTYGVRVLGTVLTQVKPSKATSQDAGHVQVYRNYTSYFR
ncbi:MAG: succinoglycan biosynthesis protein exop [Acetobacteraceae bacterium]|nr:succinoglycan biosynthesis protein exop [Acetobacteraceae bacterium]